MSNYNIDLQIEMRAHPENFMGEQECCDDTLTCECKTCDDYYELIEE